MERARPEAQAAWSARFVKQGIEVQARAYPLGTSAAEGGEAPRLIAGEDVRFEFRIQDSTSGRAIANLYPAAWIDALGEGETVDADSTQSKVEALLLGSAFVRATHDLNTYQVLVLNEDGSLHLVDPLFGFGGSKLLAAIPLAGPGHDWLLAPHRPSLFVSVPDAGLVEHVDLDRRQVVDRLAMPGPPRELALQPDGQYLWIACGSPLDADADAELVVVDAHSLESVHAFPVAAGGIECVFSPNSRWAFVAEVDHGRVHVIEVRSWEIRQTLETGQGPVSLAYSPLADRALALDGEQGALWTLDPEGSAERSALVLGPGARVLRLEPTGRFAFVLRPEHDELHVLDVADQTLLHTKAMREEPEHVAFSDEMAYVRHRSSATVSMVPLAALRSGADVLSLAEFSGGQQLPGAGRLATPAAPMVQAPGANAMLVANPADRAVYFYKEGMSAPMGSFSNYGHEARAVLVMDRSLREQRSKGVYETVLRFDRPGRYGLAFFLDAPRMVEGAEMLVHGDGSGAALGSPGPPAIRISLDPPRPIAGEACALTVRLLDAGSGATRPGVEDLGGRFYLASGSWNQRLAAERADDGSWQVQLRPPQAGIYFLALESASGALDLSGAPAQVIEVFDPAPTDPIDASQKD